MLPEKEEPVLETKEARNEGTQEALGISISARQ